jgi:hypothetical protein
VRPTSTSPTSRPQTTRRPRPPLVLVAKERREVGRQIQYACPDEMRTRAPAGTGRMTVPSNRPAHGLSVTSVSTPLINKTTPGLGNVTPRVSPPPKSRLATRHENNNRESQLSRFDCILRPNLTMRSGQQDPNLGSRQPTMKNHSPGTMTSRHV